MKHASRSALHRRVTRTGLGLALLCGVFGVVAQNDGPTQLRQYIDRQVGGLDKLKVPATNAEMPVPRQADGTVNYRYETTEAKRYLGKLLFHDPVRSARININTGVPLDLPAGTAFGGTLSASDPNIEAIANAQRRGTSCGTCHLGEAAGKAGQQLNFASGGEGRGYTDEKGNFIPRRRPQAILTKLRERALFPGDALVDALPTLATSSLRLGRAWSPTPGALLSQPRGSERVACHRPPRPIGQRGAQRAVCDRLRVQQPAAVRAASPASRDSVARRSLEPVRRSGAGKPDTAAARRAPHARTAVRGTAAIPAFVQAVPRRVSRRGRAGPCQTGDLRCS